MAVAIREDQAVEQDAVDRIGDELPAQLEFRPAKQAVWPTVAVRAARYAVSAGAQQERKRKNKGKKQSMAWQEANLENPKIGKQHSIIISSLELIA